MIICSADASHIDGVAQLFDAVTAGLNSGINYPHWKHGVYPVRATAEEALEKGELFIAVEDGKIIAAMRADHAGEQEYSHINWGINTPDEKIMMLHTLAVHPDARGKGVAKAMIKHAEELARLRAMAAIRFDTYHGNIPAATLYEAMGYKMMGYIELGGINSQPLKFKTFEKIL